MTSIDSAPDTALPAPGKGGDATPGGPPTRPRSRGPLRIGAVLALLTAVTLAATVLSLTIGSGHVPLGAVWDGVFSPDRSVRAELVVHEVRLPRTLAGLLAGVALGLAGAVIQGLTRNPLADPGLLGVNAGAAVFVVFAMSVLALTDPAHYIWFGFLGACLAAVLVYGIGSLAGKGPPRSNSPSPAPPPRPRSARSPA